MTNVQRDFIELAIRCEALRFGQFTLKSGRISPYFFNSGLFNTGLVLSSVGKLYAQRLVASGIDFDVIFGPAYKGIPFVTATAVALAEDLDRDVPYSFNRKEIKAHGEGGQLVGSPVANKRVVIIDDVMTAGTAVNEAVQILTAAEAEVVGIMIALDRQERGQQTTSAVQEVQARYGVPVISIATFSDILHYMKENQKIDPAILEAMQTYRDQYGVIAL